MNIDITELNGIAIAEIQSDQIEIKNTQDALDIMMNCVYSGADNIIWHQHQILPDFFDLKTGMAGDILQKFSTYRARLAIVGDFENVASQSLKAFIAESNKVGRIRFVSTLKEAKEGFLGA